MLKTKKDVDQHVEALLEKLSSKDVSMVLREDYYAKWRVFHKVFVISVHFPRLFYREAVLWRGG